MLAECPQARWLPFPQILFLALLPLPALGEQSAGSRYIDKDFKFIDITVIIAPVGNERRIAPPTRVRVAPGCVHSNRGLFVRGTQQKLSQRGCGDAGRCCQFAGNCFVLAGGGCVTQETILQKSVNHRESRLPRCLPFGDKALVSRRYPTGHIKASTRRF